MSEPEATFTLLRNLLFQLLDTSLRIMDDEINVKMESRNETKMRYAAWNCSFLHFGGAINFGFCILLAGYVTLRNEL